MLKSPFIYFIILSLSYSYHVVQTAATTRQSSSPQYPFAVVPAVYELLDVPHA